MKRASYRTIVLVELILVCFVVGASAALADFGATFQGLGDLYGGSFYSQAYGISADGTVVVGASNSASGQEAFRWTRAGGMTGLGDLPGGEFYGRANAVSGDGGVIVGTSSSASGTEEAFRWTQATGMVGLAGFAGGQFGSRGSAVSADGSTVAGSSWSGSGLEAYRWTSTGGMVSLGDLPGGWVESQAYGVTPTGDVVVGYGTAPSVGGTSHLAFRWTQAGGMQNLGWMPGGFGSIAQDVSDDGSVITGYGTFLPGLPAPNYWTCAAFRWTAADGFVNLGDLPGGVTDGRAFGISGNGNTIIGYGYSDLGQEAFIWDPVHNMRTLQSVLINDYGLGSDLMGWTLQAAQGISTDGNTIVGWGTNSHGQTEGWIVTLGAETNPVPVPGAALLGAIGLSCAGWRLRRRN